MRVKYVCISKYGKNLKNTGCDYELQIGLSEQPNEFWKQFFNLKFLRGIGDEKCADVIGNELVLTIDKGSNIQDRIEEIIKAVDETETVVKKCQDTLSDKNLVTITLPVFDLFNLVKSGTRGLSINN